MKCQTTSLHIKQENQEKQTPINNICSQQSPYYKISVNDSSAKVSPLKQIEVDPESYWDEVNISTVKHQDQNESMHISDIELCLMNYSKFPSKKESNKEEQNPSKVLSNYKSLQNFPQQQTQNNDQLNMYSSQKILNQNEEIRQLQEQPFIPPKNQKNKPKKEDNLEIKGIQQHSPALEQHYMSPQKVLQNYEKQIDQFFSELHLQELKKPTTFNEFQKETTEDIKKQFRRRLTQAQENSEPHNNKVQNKFTNSIEVQKHQFLNKFKNQQSNLQNIVQQSKKLTKKKSGDFRTKQISKNQYNDAKDKTQN